MKSPLNRGLWLGALVAILFLPVLFYAFGLGRLHTTLWAMFLSLTGTQACGLFAYTIALGTQFRRRGEFGVPLHKWVGGLLLFFLVIHIILALLVNLDNVWLLTIWYAPSRGAAATGALLCIVVVMSLGNFRQKFGLKPDAWRFFHVVIAWMGALLAFCHVLWIDQLVNDPLWLVLFTCLLLITVGMWVSKFKNKG